MLAVTGHRDLRPEDEGPLKQQVRSIFSDLAQKYPHTPLHLMSGLAEGADRLAASVALELGVRLIACLPMEKSAYEMDFRTAESRQEFEQLLARASRIITLPIVENAKADSAPAQGQEASPRQLQYDALGRYLVSQSQLLIALWDGMDSKQPGGTASVVRAQLGIRPDGSDIDLEAPLDLPETGPVYHIITPRAGLAAPPGEPYHLRRLYHRDPSVKGAAESYQRIFSRLDEFNQDALDCGEKLRAARECSRDQILPAKIREALGEAMGSMIDHFALADALAVHYQRRTLNALQTLIFGSGLTGVFLFELFGHGPVPMRIATLSLYLAVVVVTYAGYVLVKPGRFKTKHLDYRTLAEGLRLQVFWRLAGLKKEVADYYLRKQKTELAWIRNGIRVWSTGVLAAPGGPAFATVQTYWIDEQFNFYNKVAERDHRRLRAQERWTFAIVICTIAIAVVTLAIDCSIKSPAGQLTQKSLWRGSSSMELHGAIVIVMAMLPAIAGAIAAHSLKMAFGELQKQYQRMSNLFSRGSECLKHAINSNNAELAAKIIFDLGQEALEENGDWVLLHRERPVEMRLAG